MQNCESTLNEGMARFESNLDSIYSLAYAINSDNSIKIISFLEPPIDSTTIYKVYTARNEMGNYVKTLNYVGNCGLICKNGIVYANGNVFTQGEALYEQYKTHLRHDNFQSWYAWLDGFTGSSTLLPLETVTAGNNTTEAVTFVVRMPLEPTKVTRQLLYATLDENYLLSNLLMPDKSSATYLTLLSANGGILYTNSPDAGSEHFHRISAQSTAYGVIAVAEIDPIVSRLALEPLRQIALAFLVLYVLWGIGASVFYSYRTAKPLINISSAIIGADKYVPMNAVSYTNEYKLIHDFVKRTGLTIENYESERRVYEMQLKQLAFSRLLFERAHSVGKLEQAKIYFPNFPTKYKLAVCKLFLGKGKVLLEMSHYRLVLSNAIAKILPASAIAHVTDSEIILVLDETLDSDALLQTVKDCIAKSTGLGCAISVSAEYSQMEQLNAAYEQARLFNRLERSAAFICRASDFGIETDEHDFGRLLLDKLKFNDDMAAGDIASAKMIIQSTKEMILKKTHMEEDEIHYIFFGYLSVLKFLNRKGAQIDYPPYNPSLGVSELFDMLAAATDEMGKLLQEQKTTATDEKEIEMLQYINENVSNPDFYIKQVTTTFSVQEIYVQKILRKHTGKSFFEYVESVRMAMAKNLLLGSDSKISQIAFDCGYNSINAFYKAFKRFYGVPPATMRKRLGAEL